MWLELILFVIFLCFAIYYYITKHYGYFAKHGIKEDPGKFPFGSLGAWQCWTEGKSLFKFHEDSNEKFKDEKMYGVYHFASRSLVIRDIELAKRIIVKDAEYFNESLNFGIPYHEAKSETDKLFALMLNNMTGEEWKKMRALVSPVFTSGKLKLMIPHIDKCGENLVDFLKTGAVTGEVLEAKDVFGKFTLDSIATAGFGIESNSFKEPENVFRINALKLVRDPKYASKVDAIKFLLLMMSPKIAKLFGIHFLDKDLSFFFMDIIRKTIRLRRESEQSRNDMIDIFIEELDKKREDCFLPEEDLELGIVATAILFFFAGVDTTSTSLGVTIFGLVHHPEIQEKLRREIEDVIGDSDEVTAEHLKELKYIENVINESMRNYVTLQMMRKCTKDYRIPETDFTIPKGLRISIPPLSGCFKNQDTFDPDNFSSENNPDKFGFSGFGQGPRNCLGMRFAYQTMKIALIHTLRNFRLVKCPETTEENKLTFSLAENGFVGGFKFKVEELNKE